MKTSTGAREEAMGFYSKMVEKGFTGLMQFYDSSAWEKHPDPPAPGGGLAIYLEYIKWQCWPP